MFSEISKNLMKNDDNIELSSIDSEEKCNSFHKKKIKRAYGSIQINNRQIKEKIRNKINKGRFSDKYEINTKKSKIEINSDKDSIISILSDLM